MTKFQGKIAAMVFLLIVKIDSLRLTISLNICLQDYSLRRSISPVWWPRDTTLVPLVVALNWRPFSDDVGLEKCYVLKKHIVRSIVFG